MWDSKSQNLWVGKPYLKDKFLPVEHRVESTLASPQKIFHNFVRAFNIPCLVAGLVTGLLTDLVTGLTARQAC